MVFGVPLSARLSGLVEDDPPPGLRISSTRTAPGVSRTGDGVQGGGRRLHLRNVGTQAQGVGAPTSEVPPMTRPARAGSGTSAHCSRTTTNTTPSPWRRSSSGRRTRRIDERDFRSWPWPRGRYQVDPRPKTAVCSAGVTVRRTARVARTRSSAQSCSAFIDVAATAPARLRRPT